jgi:iron complex outermembrane receptor protein
MGRKKTDIRLQIDADNWHYRLGYQGRHNLEMGTGIGQALDPDAQFSSDRINTDFTYEWRNAAKNIKLNTRASYYHTTQQVTHDNLIYPAGTNSVYPVALFPNLFPEGVIGNPEYREEQARFNVDGEFTGFQNHIIRTGAGFFWGDIYQVTEQKNFYTLILPDGRESPLFPRPNGREEVADTPEVFLPEKGRTNYSVYVQDEWLFDPKWVLTTGVRYDNYSDFGDTINPRLALVWASSQDTTTKLLYGRAFRAPSISELYATSNPITLGNPDLTAESIDTYELALSHQVSSKLNYSSNIFYYQIDDFIVFEFNPTTLGKQAQNTGQVEGHGFEHEMTYYASDRLKLIGHYAYQKSKDKVHGGTLGENPNQDMYLRSEWDINNKYRFVSQVNWIGEQKRMYNDERPPVASYSTADFTFIATNIFKDANAKLILKNAFNANVREASQPPLKPFYQKAFVPHDYPQARRSVYAEVSYQF